MARKSPTRNKHNAEYPYDDLGPLHQPLPMPTGGMPIDKGIERFVLFLDIMGYIPINRVKAAKVIPVAIQWFDLMVLWVKDFAPLE